MHPIRAAVALLFLASPALAGPLTFQGTGKVYASVEHYEGSGRVGCLVYVKTENPELVTPVLIRSADALPCSKMYRAGRRISLAGRLMQDFPEADSMAFRRRFGATASGGQLSGQVLAVSPYTVNRDGQESGCELTINTGPVSVDDLQVWRARFDVKLIPDLCLAAQVGDWVEVDGMLWRNYCQGDVCEDRAHVVGAGFAWQ